MPVRIRIGIGDFRVHSDLKLLETSSILVPITVKAGKVDTDAKSHNDQTLRSRAAELGHEEVVKLLRKHLK